MQYKDTLNLPKSSFDMRNAKVFRLDVDANSSNNPDYILHDGPPFANGDIHLGHAVNKVIKDITARYRSQYLNQQVNFAPGWDCHGLPIENKVKSSGSNSLYDDCFKYAQKWVETQESQFKSLNIAAQYSNKYTTYSEEYCNKVVDNFKALNEMGLIYRETKPVMWSVESSTALAMADIEYKSVTTNSAYVLFPSGSVNLVAWTTTPWTLPANRALAVNSEMVYVAAYDPADSDRRVILFSKKYNEKMKLPVLYEVRGKSLIGKEYINTFTNYKGRILEWNEVSEDVGTGVVHIAPGHGLSDYDLCKKNQIEVYCPVLPNGKYDNTVPSRLVDKKVLQSEESIFDLLKESFQILSIEPFTHDYPFDERSKKATITRATDQVFVALDKPFYNGKTLREFAIEICDNVEFDPVEGKNKLIKMLKDRPDWCISRQRVWGINIPDTNYIFDVWFESGSSWQVLGDKVADVYIEGHDQFRGWFQHSLLLSAAIRKKAPFKKIVYHGFVVKPDGTKLAKSDPENVAVTKTVDELGSDSLRLWIASVDFRKEIASSPSVLKEFSSKYFKVRNTLKYLLSNLYDFDGNVLQANPKTLDAWIRNQICELEKRVCNNYESMQYHKVVQDIMVFCNDQVSSVYANAMKDRLYCDKFNSARRRTAQSTMAILLNKLCGMLKPIIPSTVLELKEHFNYENIVMPKVEIDDRWDVILQLREGALKKMDDLKKQQNLNKSVDTEVVIPNDLSDIGDEIEDLVAAGEHSSGENLEVFDSREKYQSCERCWKRKRVIVNGLCQRCKDSLE